MTQNQEIFLHLQKVLHLVRINIPYLAELVDNVELIECSKIETAGIFATGRLIYNPDWFKKLSLYDATFVIAHEIMHLALRTHDRVRQGDEEWFNVTHDFIINKMLKDIFGLNTVPANGLDWDEDYKRYYDIEEKSAEELMKFIKEAYRRGAFTRNILKEHWSVTGPGKDDNFNNPFADQLKELVSDGKKKDSKEEREYIKLHSDVLTDDLERKLFPGLSNRRIADEKSKIYKSAGKTLSMKLINQLVDDTYVKGTEPGEYAAVYNAIRAFHKPPWEVALQAWMEHMARTGRTYSRPSRRGEYKDLVRTGYKREGHTLHIIIDTSGSMESELSKVLGAIAMFCEAMQIPEIHIVQCDTGVSDDNWYTPDQLTSFEVKGLGGSDMSAGMYLMAEDDQIENVIVITDGYVDFPDKAMPFETLWVITEKLSQFKPPYGQVIYID